MVPTTVFRNRTIGAFILMAAFFLIAKPASAQGWVRIEGLGQRWWLGKVTAPYLQIVGIKPDLVRRDQLHGIGEFKITLKVKNIGSTPFKGSVSAIHMVGTSKMPNPEDPFDPNDPRNPWILKASKEFARRTLHMRPGDMITLTGKITIPLHAGTQQGNLFTVTAQR